MEEQRCRLLSDCPSMHCLSGSCLTQIGQENGYSISLTMFVSDGLQHRSSWPINNSIPLAPNYLSSMPSDIAAYSLTASGYPLQHSADGMVRLVTETFRICSYISIVKQVRPSSQYSN